MGGVMNREGEIFPLWCFGEGVNRTGGQGEAEKEKEVYSSCHVPLAVTTQP